MKAIKNVQSCFGNIFFMNAFFGALLLILFPSHKKYIFYFETNVLALKFNRFGFLNFLKFLNFVNLNFVQKERHTR